MRRGWITQNDKRTGRQEPRQCREEAARCPKGPDGKEVPRDNRDTRNNWRSRRGSKQQYKSFLNYTSDVSAKIWVFYKEWTVFQNFGKGLKFHTAQPSDLQWRSAYTVDNTEKKSNNIVNIYYDHCHPLCKKIERTMSCQWHRLTSVHLWLCHLKHKILSM
jgi:hypothetical protein